MPDTYNAPAAFIAAGLTAQLPTYSRGRSGDWAYGASSSTIQGWLLLFWWRQRSCSLALHLPRAAPATASHCWRSELSWLCRETALEHSYNLSCKDHVRAVIYGLRRQPITEGEGILSCPCHFYCDCLTRGYQVLESKACGWKRAQTYVKRCFWLQAVLDKHRDSQLLSHTRFYYCSQTHSSRTTWQTLSVWGAAARGMLFHAAEIASIHTFTDLLRKWNIIAEIVLYFKLTALIKKTTQFFLKPCFL